MKNFLLELQTWDKLIWELVMGVLGDSGGAMKLFSLDISLEVSKERFGELALARAWAN